MILCRVKALVPLRMGDHTVQSTTCCISSSNLFIEIKMDLFHRYVASKLLGYINALKLAEGWNKLELTIFAKYIYVLQPPEFLQN